MESQSLLGNGQGRQLSRRDKTLRMVEMAMLAAISVVLVFLTVPYPLAPFLKYDFADVPVLLAAFILGPGAGLAVLFVAAFIQAMFLGGNGPIGLLMHFVGSGTLLLAASLIYRQGRYTTRSMVLGLLAGTVLRAAVMIPLNFIFTPNVVSGIKIPVAASVFFHGGVGAYAEEALAAYHLVKGMLLTTLLPFNLTQAGANSVICFLLFKSLSLYLKKKA